MSPRYELPEECEMTSWTRVASSNLEPGMWQPPWELEMEGRAIPENKKLFQAESAALTTSCVDPHGLHEDRAGHSYKGSLFLTFYGEQEKAIYSPDLKGRIHLFIHTTNIY